MSMKNPLTPAGIEPATFRFVTQHLKLCAAAVPVYRQETDVFQKETFSYLLQNDIFSSFLKELFQYTLHS